jgi:hypothetical protein
MSLTLQPNNSFTVVRQIPNHLDSATYYVQAVIRNAYTDVILDTLQLDNKGSQRFKKDWNVIADPSGQGFYISIVTSVYTDSGYTTKSENYGDDENTYLVQDRITVGRIGGQGSGIDTFDLRRVVKEEMDNLLEAIRSDEKKEDASETEDDDKTEQIVALLTDIKNVVSEDKEEKDYSSDLSKISSKIDLAIKTIQDKDVTEPTDLGPVLEQIDTFKTEVSKILESFDKDSLEMMKATAEELQILVTNAINKALKSANFNLQMPFKVQALPEEQEKEKKSLPDINKLSI